MSMLTDIGAYLVSELGLVLGGDEGTLFLGQMPDEPDTCTALYSRPGLPPDFSLGATPGVAHTPNYDNLRLQVKVRRADSPTAYPDGEDLIWSIHRLLSVVDITLSGTRYINIEPKDSPALLEEDKKGRLSFVANFDIQREVS